MQDRGYITFLSNRKEIVVDVANVLYCITRGAAAEIHTNGGAVYRTRMKFTQIEQQLGEDFIKIHRGCIAFAMAIHEINDKIVLNNGEMLDYAVRRKKEIVTKFHTVQKRVIEGFHRDGIPTTAEKYREHYKVFDNMPFAFTDIELIFNDDTKAVDWIFRYGNTALANLEKVSLDKLIDHSFGSVFPQYGFEVA